MSWYNESDKLIASECSQENWREIAAQLHSMLLRTLDYYTELDGQKTESEFQHLDEDIKIYYICEKERLKPRTISVEALIDQAKIQNRKDKSFIDD